jgi:hypothetical protein
MLDKCSAAVNRRGPPDNLYQQHINREEKWYLPYICALMHSYNNFSDIGTRTCCEPDAIFEVPRADTPKHTEHKKENHVQQHSI